MTRYEQWKRWAAKQDKSYFAKKSAAYRKKHPDRVKATAKKAAVKYKQTANPELARRTHRRYHLKHAYGITLDHYEDLLVRCGGKCTVCRQPETGIRRGELKSLDVDHNHQTGEIRELLCSGCNAALGLLKEDPDRIDALAAYIRKYTRS